MNYEKAALWASLMRNKGVNQSCPRCGHLHFSILGEALMPIVAMEGLLGTFTSEMAVVVVGCNNCGYVTQHVASVLQDKAEKGPGIVMGGPNG
jgi:bacterioferritin-associated ferredoxin